ncbi:hypothetical protein HMPREF1550_01294 [Actinomyces sp. oral taxon 877 str. F0543]|nr:hypothetical protein HMPREF1550_01294 [Actinomyces sp. oral taxon 877 str. F0543]
MWAGKPSTRPPVGARAGSSPRGRGATWCSGASSGWCRLIPARAGRYCARTAPSRAPRVALGQVSRHWGRLVGIGAGY